MISVRISEEEYAALRHLCSVTGARSVSDLARDAMNVFLSSASRGDGYSPHLGDFQAHIQSLGMKIEQLASEIKTLKANVTN
jgi:hypothetical protein